MAVSYTVIIDAIDTAINSGVAGPGSIEVGDRKITYRSLQDLIETRKYYSQLAASQAGQGFRITAIKSTSA